MTIDKEIIENIERNDSDFVSLDLGFKKLVLSDLRELANALAKNNNITTLDLSGNLIGDEGAEIIAQVPHVTTLIISENNIRNKGAETLSKNTTLKTLILTNNEIDSTGAKLLSESKTLTTLDLTGNQVDDEGAVALAGNTILFSLILSHNKIGIIGLQALANNTTLNSLNLSYNEVSSEGAQIIAKSTTLKSLNLAGNNIETIGIIALAHNSSFESLDVSFNKVSDEGASALANHPTLRFLNLSYNQVGCEGAQALSRNLTLNELMMNYNMTGDEGVAFLAKHKRLKRLSLAGNKVGFEGAHALSLNTEITSLNLTYNLLGDCGAVILSRNTTLSELFLSYNEIGDHGAMAWADNTTVKVLYLNYNLIGEKGRDALAKNKNFSSFQVSLEQPPKFTADNLSTIFLLSESYLCITSFNCILQFFNPSFVRSLGYKDDELLTKSFFEILHPNNRDAVEKMFKTANKFPMKNFETQCLCKDGSYRLVRWSAQIKHDRFYIVGSDITELRKVETQIKKIEKKSFETSIQETTAYAAKQTDFVSRLSHEIRNPLNGIYGLIEVIDDKLTSVQSLIDQESNVIATDLREKLNAIMIAIKESLDNMGLCIDHQQTILNDNIDICRIGEKKLTLANTPVNLNTIIKNVISMMEVAAKRKGLRLSSQLPEQEIVIKGDSTRIKQIIINLIGNSIKFTHYGGIDVILTVENATEQQITAKFEIVDTGIGLSDEETSVLFERYSQASANIGGQYGGSGLGLYLTKTLVERMQGNIYVTSEKGKGSVFSFVIPFETPSAEENILSYQQQHKAPPSPLLVNQELILIVDDNEINRLVLKTQLQKLGYQCLCANDGLEALEAFDKQVFFLVFMDVRMPRMDGITATQEIRKREQERGLPRTPIIAISANALEKDREEALQKGMDDYIVKPFKRDDIYQKIKTLTRTFVMPATLSSYTTSSLRLTQT